MPRKKTSNDEEKSTVMKIVNEFDWGRILYNACYVFNKNFAEYLEDYARRYDAGEVVVDDAEQEAGELIRQRDKLIDERTRLHDEVRKASAEKVQAYRKYAKAMPIGEAVTGWRRERLGTSTNVGSDSYHELMVRRHDLRNSFRSCVERERKAINAERAHIDANLFATRTINHKVKNIMKMVDKHHVPMQEGHSMADDAKLVKELLLSDGQVERLMAVCLNILNTYSEKEFSTLMGVLDRERIVENIYEFFSNFEQNYDFISGCYEIDEETRTLRMKPIDVLACKIYNGYFFTIRGYVQRSYSSVRFERFNVESADANWGQETDNGNHGIDRKASSESGVETAGAVASREPLPLDDGMLDIWTDCNNYLCNNIENMSSEIASRLSEKFPRNPYYSTDGTLKRMETVMVFLMDNINEELVSGNVIGNRLKHIILDSMGGAETNEEWRQNVLIISKTIAKYIRKFFSSEVCRQVVDEAYARCTEDD